jgi:hypothetical protein
MGLTPVVRQHSFSLKGIQHLCILNVQPHLIYRHLMYTNDGKMLYDRAVEYKKKMLLVSPMGN